MKFPFALFCLLSLVTPSLAQTEPEWCRALPRPEYQSLKRVPLRDSWFEVYEVTSGVFAIYEPHQYEETISYLILGDKRALLFDTGMGIGDLKQVTAELTRLPIVVVNSHTHNDHVGDNWQFKSIYGMNSDFTRKNARGSRQDAQAEIAAGNICGELPQGFKAKAYATRAWKITHYILDGDHIALGGRVLEVIATPGHTPDAICLLDRAHGLLFSGDTYYPATIWLYRPETDLDAYSASIRRLARAGAAAEDGAGRAQHSGCIPRGIIAAGGCIYCRSERQDRSRNYVSGRAGLQSGRHLFSDEEPGLEVLIPQAS